MKPTRWLPLPGSTTQVWGYRNNDGVVEVYRKRPQDKKTVKVTIPDHAVRLVRGTVGT